MKESYTDMLHSIIGTCLCGPRGDPDRCHNEAAAYAAAILIDDGWDIDEDTRAVLCEYNVQERDYLKEAQKELKKLKRKHKENKQE